MLVRLSDPSWDHHTLGWEPCFERQLSPKERARYTPARVIEAYRKRFLVHTGSQVFWAIARGALFHNARDPTELPAVGDWALVERAAGQEHARLWRVLKRRTVLVRQAAGERTEAQVIAANLDGLFVTTSMNQEFNPRRIERYMTLARDSGAEVTLLLNKSDLAEDPEDFLERAKEAAPQIEALALSMVDGTGRARLKALLEPRRTYGFIGSSGVGKSTIVNDLFGSSLQETGEVRATDDRGRHTTTSRQLIVLPSGALLVDTPGMRELGIWQVEEQDLKAFSDVIALAESCKFRDCQHLGREVGCAVRQALERDELSEARLHSFQKLSAELASQRQRQREAARASAKKRNARRPK